MSAGLRHYEPRGIRSRIVVLTPDASHDVIRQSEVEQDRIVSVRNIFSALCAIARSSAREPIDALVLTRIDRPYDTVIQAVRRLDPSVLVFLAAGASDESERGRAVAAGFDGVIPGPFTSEAINRLLDGDNDRTESPEDAVAPPAVEPSLHESTSNLASISESANSDVSRPQAKTAHISPFDDVATDDHGDDSTQGPLGDSDLVAAILRSPDSLPELALRLIVQETGWSDLTFLMPESEGDRSALSGTIVEFLGEVIGSLKTAHAHDEEVRPWADWFARWATLAQRYGDLQHAAHTDPLTGAWNRRYFDAFLPRILKDAHDDRRTVTLLVFDVDDLKVYNDRHGHDAGDDVLRETVRLMKSMIRKGDRVCRIGGDEFVVIFADRDPPRKAGSMPVESVEQLVRRFQEGICRLNFSKLGREAAGHLSISAGVATYPWDGVDAESLLRVADQLALESKRKGKNCLTIGSRRKSNAAGDDTR